MIISESNERKWRKLCEKSHLNDDAKFKPKKFKRPPKYLRLDQPKNKWIVRPTRLDLLKDAEAVLESLIENRVPRTRRFQRRQKKRKKWRPLLAAYHIKANFQQPAAKVYDQLTNTVLYIFFDL